VCLLSHYLELCRVVRSTSSRYKGLDLGVELAEAGPWGFEEVNHLTKLCEGGRLRSGCAGPP
jgi:hypothetical protein